MSGFFYGWRRKTGVVTLLMACVLMGAWLRCRSRDDVVYFVFLDRQHRIYAVENRIIWLTTPDPNLFLDMRCGIGDDTENNELKYIDKVWHGNEIIKKLSFRRWNIPIWSLVLPPTVLSAYLILWKPRKRA
jgi:hypothetical protein